MSRIHGRNGIIYIGINGPGGGGSGITAGQMASPMAFLTDWSPDASGDFSGFYDTATAQTYVAATDGLSRNMYLYPSTVGSQGTSPGQYFFGTVLPDYSVSGGVSAAVSLKSTWNAASPVIRYPASGIAGS